MGPPRERERRPCGAPSLISPLKAKIDTDSSSTEPLGDAFADWALWYAAEGHPMVPLHSPVDGGCSCGRAGCSSPGKHPRTPNGLDDASIDADQVAEWWGRWPDANIGIRTGVTIDVLDIDDEEGLDALDAAGPDDAGVLEGPMVRTSKGLHIWFASAGTRNRTRMLDSVDWRGASGYVVAPPSLHASGVRYEWTDEYGPESPLVAPPAWLRDLVIGKPSVAVTTSSRGGVVPAGRYGRAALERELGNLMMAREGERNDALNTAAFCLGQLVAGGELDRTLVVTELAHAGQRLGLGEREVERTIVSGLTSGAREPRRRKVAS